MTFIRSLIFNVVFFSVLIVGLIVGIPWRFFDGHYTCIFWDKFSWFLQGITSVVGGISCKFENEQYLLKEPAVYAFRHESMWETMMLIYKFKYPVFVLKKELLDVPLFGIMAKKSGAIAVDRENGAKSLVEVLKKISETIAAGRPVIIFPEGTRVPTGQHVPMKRGISLFYKKLNCPIVPVVHNAGRFWPRRGFIKHPGTITVRFLEPILPGLTQDEFMEKLNSVFKEEVEKLNSLEG